MKFSDKLKKLRKENNLSQERLADLLEVSRQAVSKWESGSSYPDMEKLKKMCKVLNCTLEDLMDDGFICKTETNKINFGNCFNDFLKIVTNTYNMFCTMKFKEKIKCILEMLFITFVLWLMSKIVFAIFNVFIFNLFLNIPKIGTFIDMVFENILLIILVIADIIVFIHLFKVRYLDYYITIEDQSAVTQTLEDPIDKDTKKKERIVIRDPKHSSSNFLNVLATIVVTIIKFMFILIMIPFAISFIGFTIIIFWLLCYLKYGIIFLTLVLAILGLLGITYIFIELIYNFIFSRRQNLKRIFIIFISSLGLFGAGIGLTLGVYTSFNNTNVLPKEYRTSQVSYVKMNDNTIINSDNIIYTIDDSEKNIKFESDYVKYTIDKDLIYNPKRKVLNIYSYQDSNKMLKLLFEDIKNKRQRDYNELGNAKINVIVSRENYDKLIKNYSNYVSECEE